MTTAIEYPYADQALITVGEELQTCASCGKPIVLTPGGEHMTFDTRPNPEAPKGFDILTLHGSCDDRPRPRRP